MWQTIIYINIKVKKNQTELISDLLLLKIQQICLR